MPLTGPNALTENDVIEYVCAYLESRSYVIEQRLHTKQTGDDIVAARPDGVRLFIEAKGSTSAQAGSKRHGLGFNSSQVSVHVAEATYRALKTLSNGDRDINRAGIALPDNELHHRYLSPVQPMLDELGVAIFWVDGDGNVTVQSSWAISA